MQQEIVHVSALGGNQRGTLVILVKKKITNRKSLNKSAGVVLHAFHSFHFCSCWRIDGLRNYWRLLKIIEEMVESIKKVIIS